MGVVRLLELQEREKLELLPIIFLLYDMQKNKVLLTLHCTQRDEQCDTLHMETREISVSRQRKQINYWQMIGQVDPTFMFF